MWSNWFGMSTSATQHSCKQTNTQAQTPTRQLSQISDTRGIYKDVLTWPHRGHRGYSKYSQKGTSMGTRSTHAGRAHAPAAAARRARRRPLRCARARRGTRRGGGRSRRRRPPRPRGTPRRPRRTCAYSAYPWEYSEYPFKGRLVHAERRFAVWRFRSALFTSVGTSRRAYLTTTIDRAQRCCSDRSWRYI